MARDEFVVAGEDLYLHAVALQRRERRRRHPGSGGSAKARKPAKVSERSSATVKLSLRSHLAVGDRQHAKALAR